MHPWRRSPAEPGVGIGTLYRRFPTRFDLADAILASSVECVVAAATAALLSPTLDRVRFLPGGDRSPRPPTAASTT